MSSRETGGVRGSDGVKVQPHRSCLPRKQHGPGLRKQISSVPASELPVMDISKVFWKTGTDEQGKGSGMMPRTSSMACQ